MKTYIVFILFISYIASLSIKHIYSFGDDYSFIGSPKILDNDKLYTNGRLSDGPIWLDYLSKKMKANLTSFASRNATSNNKKYNVDINGGTLGCLQQVEKFKEYISQNTDYFESVKTNSLITFNFGANEIILPTSSAQEVAVEYEACFTSLMEIYQFNYVLFSTSTILDTLPLFQILDEKSKMFIGYQTESFNKNLKQVLLRLEEKYPNSNIIEDHFRDFWLKISNSIKLLKQPCIINSVKCNNPDGYFYWDGTHPTTKVHRLLASDAYNYLKNY